MCSVTPALSADELGSNKESNWEGNLERAHSLDHEYTRRPPDDFKPDEKFFALVKHRNQLSDLDTQIALFCNHEFKTGATDWQSRWAQWWIRAASYERQPALSVSPEVRAKYSPATIRSAQNLKEWANG